MSLAGRTAPRWWTLRVRATVAATLAIAVVLGVAAMVLVTVLEDRLTTSGDDLARARALDLVALAHSGDLPRSVDAADDDGVAQVVTADGRVLAASPNVAEQPRIASFVPSGGPGAGGFDVRVVDAPDDAETETYRLGAATGTTPSGTVVVAYVGTSLESVSEATSTVRRTVLVGIPALTLVLGAVAWWVVGRVLRRLDRMRAEVDLITDADEGRRVDGGAASDEVGRLARTLNAMLDRLDASARRQRDLVADVSHDLRTPLAAQRLSLELALRDPSRVDVDRLRDEVLGATDHMERLVSDLLVLAAEDAGPVAPDPRPFDLDEVVREEAERVALGRRTPIDVGGLAPAPALGDADDARRVVRNLLDNAAAHARTVVEVSTGLSEEQAWCAVSDDGPGVAPEDRDLVFERFHRGDEARVGGGSGLGLTIARTLARRHGGDVRVDDHDGPGSRFVLTLPALGTARPPGRHTDRGL